MKVALINRHLLLGNSGRKPEQADGGAVTLIQRFGSAAKLNVHLHCLVLDGVCRLSADGTLSKPLRRPEGAGAPGETPGSVLGQQFGSKIGRS